MLTTCGSLLSLLLIGRVPPLLALMQDLLVVIIAERPSYAMLCKCAPFPIVLLNSPHLHAFIQSSSF